MTIMVKLKKGFLLVVFSFLLLTVAACAGEDGTEGPQGPEGPEGPVGEQGPEGPEGPEGPAGQDGEDGLDGADGQDGADGVDGQDGEDGVDGADGQDGVDGEDGEDGTSAFEAYLANYPGYPGDEETWINALSNDELVVTIEAEYNNGVVYYDFLKGALAPDLEWYTDSGFDDEFDEEYILESAKVYVDAEAEVDEITVDEDAFFTVFSVDVSENRVVFNNGDIYNVSDDVRQYGTDKDADLIVEQGISNVAIASDAIITDVMFEDNEVVRFRLASDVVDVEFDGDTDELIESTSGNAISVYEGVTIESLLDLIKPDGTIREQTYTFEDDEGDVVTEGAIENGYTLTITSESGEKATHTFSVYERSANADLTEIYVDNDAVSVEADELEYDYTVDYATTHVSVYVSVSSAAAEAHIGEYDATTQVAVELGDMGSVTSVEVLVKAEDGTEQTYTLDIYRPTFMETVTVGAVSASIDEDDPFVYHAELPYGEKVSEQSLEYALFSAVSVTDEEYYTEDRGETWIIEFKYAEEAYTYYVHVTVADPSEETGIDSIEVDGEDATTTGAFEYEVKLPEDTDVTTSSFIVGLVDDNAKVEMTTTSAVEWLITVTAEDGVAEQEYTLTVVYQSDDNSVDTLKVDGVEGTTTGAFEYKVDLPYGTDFMAVDLDIETTNDEATVGTPRTNDQGKTWTVKVTSEYGTVQDYEIKLYESAKLDSEEESFDLNDMDAIEVDVHFPDRDSNAATDVDSVSVTGSGLNVSDLTLDENNWDLDDDTLTIKEAYLQGLLETVTSQAIFTVEFDKGMDAELVVNAIETHVVTYETIEEGELKVYYGGEISSTAGHVNNVDSGDRLQSGELTFTATPTPSSVEYVKEWTVEIDGTTVTAGAANVEIDGNTLTISEFDGDVHVSVEFYTFEASVTPSAVDFGEAFEGYDAHDYEKEITIENTGSGELTGLEATISGAGFEITHDLESTLNASSEASLKITPGVDDLGSLAAHLGLPAGHYEATVIITADHGLEYTVDIEFLVESQEIEVSDDVHLGEEVYEYETVTGATFTVENTGTGDITGLEVEKTRGNTSSFDLDFTTETLDESTTNVSFTVTPKEGLTVGAYYVELTISADNIDDQTVRVDFEVVEQSFESSVDPVEGEIVLDELREDYTASTSSSITLTNEGTGDLTVTGAALSGASPSAFDITDITDEGVNAGDDLEINVDADAGLAPDTYEADLTIYVEYGNGETGQYEYTVKVTVHPHNYDSSVSDDITFDKLAADYDSVTEASITVTNEGTDDLSVTGVAFANDYFELDGTVDFDPDTAAGEEFSFDVKPVQGLTPGATYTDTVTIYVQYADDSTVSYDVSLSVEVADYVSSVDVTSDEDYDFGTLNVGYVVPEEEAEFSFTNDGNQSLTGGALVLEDSDAADFLDLDDSGFDASLDVDESYTFTVSLKSGAPVGTHSVDVILSYDELDADIHFTVNFEVE